MYELRNFLVVKDTVVSIISETPYVLQKRNFAYLRDRSDSTAHSAEPLVIVFNSFDLSFLSLTHQINIVSFTCALGEYHLTLQEDQ